VVLEERQKLLRDRDESATRLRLRRSKHDLAVRQFDRLFLDGDRSVEEVDPASTQTGELAATGCAIQLKFTRLRDRVASTGLNPLPIRLGFAGGRAAVLASQWSARSS
jgi:hypothetical protein